uniref:(northern house mosquito) hypothetical protein n=1 Tax=Culex pipiens TaxID=7175 RepID=A0A8D8C463_CULPI
MSPHLQRGVLRDPRVPAAGLVDGRAGLRDDGLPAHVRLVDHYGLRAGAMAAEAGAAVRVDADHGFVCGRCVVIILHVLSGSHLRWKRLPSRLADVPQVQRAFVVVRPGRGIVHDPGTGRPAAVPGS